jgi:hypothetical protein
MSPTSSFGFGFGFTSAVLKTAKLYAIALPHLITLEMTGILQLPIRDCSQSFTIAAHWQHQAAIQLERYPVRQA